MTLGRNPRLLAAVLAGAIVFLGCAPKPSPSASPTAPPPTPSPTPEPTPAPQVGVDWGEPVRLPRSENRASAAHAVSFDGRLFVAATLVTADGLGIGIWSSIDGVEWTLGTPGELVNGAARGLIVGPEGLVLAGLAGVSRLETPYASTARAAVWTSRDGQSWTAADGFPAAPGGISDIAGDASGLIAVGYAASPPDGSCPQAASWRSSDGLAWEALPSPADCAGLYSVAGHDGTFVILGQVPDPEAPSGSVGMTVPVAWLVAADADWEPLEAFPPPEARYTVVDGPAGFVAILAGLTGGQAEVSPVLTSTDGRTWTRIDGDPFEPGAPNHSPLATLGYADAFFVGWTTGDGQGFGEVHLARSVDGRTWTIAPTSAALNRTPAISSVVSHDGRVVAFGGQAGFLAWVSPPPANGPATPELLEPEVAEATLPGNGTPRALAFRGDDALAVGSETDMATGSTVGRVWRWSAASRWEAVATTGLEGATLSALTDGPGGWLALGTIRRPAAAPNQGWQDVPQAWRSSDGQAWSAASLDEAHVGVAIMRLTTVIAGGPGYIVSGWSRVLEPACGSNSLGIASVVLVSADGVDWTAASDPDLACDQINDIAAADGRLVAVGAETRIVVVPGPSPTPCDMDICTSGGGRSEARAAAWISTDGLEWTPATELEAAWGRSGLTSVAAGPGGFVATSIGDTVYSSADGERWSTSYIPISPSIQALGLAAGSRNGYLAAAINQTQEQFRFTLYFSADGVTWQEIAANALPLEPGTFISAIDGSNDAGFLVLGTKPAAPPAKVSWQVALP